MRKLLDKYKADPSEKNLAAIRKYLSKHPMAEYTHCLELSRLGIIN